MVVNYGFIGCGMMGQEHVQNIALLDDTNVSVVYEPDAGMRNAVRALLPNVTFVDSIDALLAHSALDCIVITSPNFRHVEHLQAIAAKRTLPILCEKPLFTDPDDLPRMQALQADYGAPIWVAMEYRYMPPLARMVARTPAVTGGVKLLTIVEHRFPFLPKVDNWNRFNSQSGGTFVEKCCHFFDLMRFILGDDPIRVMASAGQEVNHLDETYDGHVSDIWDCGYVIVDFKRGARAMLELSMFSEGSEFQEIIHAVGPSGKIECKIPGPLWTWGNNDCDKPEPLVIESPRTQKGPVVQEVPVDQALLDVGQHHGSTFYQHQKFLDIVRNGGTPEVGLSDGIWAVRMGMAAQESARTGQAVML